MPTIINTSKLYNFTSADNLTEKQAQQIQEMVDAKIAEALRDIRKQISDLKNLVEHQEKEITSLRKALNRLERWGGNPC